MVEYGQTPHIGPICINKTHKTHKKPTLKTHKIGPKFRFIEILGYQNLIFGTDSLNGTFVDEK